MSVIIRLQGLPWSASAMNIRHFFAGLNIPAGGVHIIGGEGGDAFIAFSSDDDARMAMKKNMCPLNGTTVQLFLSSKSEMQSVIDAARTASAASVAATGAGTMAQNMQQQSLQQQQQQQQQQRQQFPSMPNAYAMENQNQNNIGGVLAGQPTNDFSQQMQNQFARNDWQGFQMYGSRGDDQSQQMFNQFQQNQNQRMPGNQIEGRFPSVPGVVDRTQFSASQQQGKAFQEGSSQFNDASSQMQHAVPPAMGIGGMHQGTDMPGVLPVAQKQSLFGEQIGGRPGNIPASSSGIDNPAAMLGNFGAMGRGQSFLPGQVGIGPNRSMFNANMGRSIPGNEMSGNIPGNRSLLGDGILGRPNTLEEKSLGESMDTMGQNEKFTNQFTSESVQSGLDGRKAEMMDWGGENQIDARFQGSQKLFDQDIPGDVPNMNRDKMQGPDGRPFQQFPFRGEHDRARLNRVPEGAERADPLLDPGANRLMNRQEREPPFPVRDIRTGSRFSAAQEPEGRFYPDKFAERPVDRFGSDQLPADDMLASTKYPPEGELQGGPGDGRPLGQLPLARGRHDELRYPADDRQFPSEQRFSSEDRRLPNRDQAYPPEHDQFSEGERKFPPSGRGYLPDERRHMVDDRRFPSGPDGRRFPPDEARFPPEERIGLHSDRTRPEEFGGRRPGDNPFAPDDTRFREREEELRRRDAFGRGRRAVDDRFTHDHPNEGRPDIRPGFQDFEEGEESRRFPPDRRFPPERAFRGEEGEEDFQGPPKVLNERRPGVSRWDRERFDDWQEESDSFPRPGGPRGPLSDTSADFPGMGRPGNVDVEGSLDMDRRTGRDLMAVRGPLEGRRGPLLEGRGPLLEGRGPLLEGRGPLLEGRGGPGIEAVRGPPDADGMRGPGIEERRGPGVEGFRAPIIERRGHPLEGMRGRGIEGMRGRGIEGLRGRGIEGRGGLGIDIRRGPGISSLMEENSFDYGHGRPVTEDAEEEEEEEFDETADFDSRFPVPVGRGGIFDHAHRGRGDAFFNRGRPGLPLGRGRGLDVDRRFEDAGPEGRINMDVDARNVGGRPDGPPLRSGLGDGKIPDFSVKPGSGKGLLGDAPGLERPGIPKLETEKKDPLGGDALRRDLDNRSTRRSNDRERDYRSSDRRGRDKEESRSGERDRSRYRYERDRSDRRRSRSRERGGRDGDERRSRDRSSSTKKDHEVSKSDMKAESKKRCIYIKNLPVDAAYKDIRRLMQPIDVPFDGLKLISNKQGQRTGDAFVQFRHADDAARAVRRNGEKMNGKVITISLCTDEEFSAGVDSLTLNKKETAAPGTGDNQKAEKDDRMRYIVQVKNLPLNITKQDIVQFFKGLAIDNNGEAVYIEYDQTGIATGNGFIEFKSDYDYKKALTQDGTSMGTVAIRVFPGKKEEADSLKQKQPEMLQRAALRTVASSRMIQQRPQGQPLRPQGQQPRPQGQQPQPQGQQPRPQGQQPRPQGQQPRPQGQQPRPQGLQPRPQGLQPRPQGQPQQPQGQPPRPQGQQPRPGLMGLRPGLGPQQPTPTSQPAPGNQNTSASTSSDSSDTVCVHIQGLPLLATPQDIREFFSDCQIALRGINIAHDSRGKPLGEGFVEFKFKSDFEKAIKKDKTSLGRHIVAVKPIGKKEMMERLDNARGVQTSQGSQQNPSQTTDDQNKSQNQGPPQSNEKQQVSPQSSQQGTPAAQNSQGPKPLMPNPVPTSAAPTQGVPVTPGGSKSIPPGVLNKNWYYVRCQNFPPDIAIAEILSFFQGFRPIGESIRLHYSSDGKPTGNAVVGFGSSEEAQRALQRLNMKVCRQNVVTLHPA